MIKVLSAAFRGVYLGLIISTLLFLGAQVAQRSTWYKEHLYKQLVRGEPREQTRAAVALARLGAQDELLDALKLQPEPVRDIARRALEHIWFNAAGHEAYELTQAAYRAAEQDELGEALELLNKVIAKYPTYAEGWNRRASVRWQLGQYQQSIEDCEHALALNPHHYGAWQGIGVCHLELGNIYKACHALREALKITPHDEITRRSLRKCEDLLRVYPHPAKEAKTYDLV